MAADKPSEKPDSTVASVEEPRHQVLTRIITDQRFQDWYKESASKRHLDQTTMSLEDPDLPDEVKCEVCGAPVKNDGDAQGIVINYWGLVAPWSYSYAFCEDHVPKEEEFEEIKNRIKQGLETIGK